MKIDNVRIGFATNSSSTHSMIWVDNAAQYDDGNSHDDFDYGWDNFTLGTQEAKLKYVAATVAVALTPNYPGWLVKLINKELSGYAMATDYAVDHQSSITLPEEPNGSKIINRAFVEDMIEFVSRDDVLLLGGNDNDMGHPLRKQGPSCGLNILRESHHRIARKDGDWWILFNRESGDKIRLSFKRNPIALRCTSVPELVDISITDFCVADCAFCYRNSNYEGKHADNQSLYNVMRSCEEMGVFEIAIGGGEPLDHPNIKNILSQFKNSTLRANLTTRHKSWLRDDKMRNLIFDTCGAVGISVDSAAEIEDMATALQYHGIRSDRVMAHVIMGTVSEHEFRAMAVASHNSRIPLLLLGFKESGRGFKFKQKSGWKGYQKYDWFESVLIRLQEDDLMPARLGMDTPLVAELQPILERLEVPEWMYRTHEGENSMFIDAVHQTAGPSSYDSKNEKELASLHYTDIIKAWQTIPRGWSIGTPKRDKQDAD